MFGQPDNSLATNGPGQNGYGVHSPDGHSLMAAFVAELVMTMMFPLVIFGPTSKDAPKDFAGISTRLSLLVIPLLGILITGTCVDPAIGLGPAIFVGGDALLQLWLFGLAPIIGGILGALIRRSFLRDERFESTMEATMSPLGSRNGAKLSRRGKKGEGRR